MSPVYAVVYGLATASTAVIVLTAVAILAGEARHRRQRIRQLVRDLREQEDLVTALRRGHGKKDTQIALLLKLVDEWTQAWEANGGEVIRTPLGEPEVVVSHAELPADLIARTIEQVERHANQGEAP